VRWQRWSDRAIFNEEGRIVEYQSVGRDITDRVTAEEAVRESEQLLTDIIDHLPDATFVIDREGKVIAWNRGIEEMTGVAAQDMIGKGDYEYAIPFYGERRPILIDLIQASPEEVERRYTQVTRSGSVLMAETTLPQVRGRSMVLWGKATPLFNEKGEMVGAIESIRDLTRQKEIEVALRESEHRFRELAELLPQVVFEADTRGTLTFVNQYAFEMFGYTEEEFKRGFSLFQAIHPSDRERVAGDILALSSASSPQVGEYLGLRKNGTTFPFKAYTTSIYRENQLAGIRGILIDVTEEKLTQEVEKKAFEQIEKNINQLSILNDHIRNPLAVIVGLADLAGGENSEKILRQAREIDRIITELDMGWLESEKIREFMRKHYGVGERENQG
jgi:PAS domain S-box-containing protein